MTDETAEEERRNAFDDLFNGHDRAGRFTEGNQEADVQHGGGGAVYAIQLGLPFKGLASQEERHVIADLEAHGRGAMVWETVVRLHTACRLYWGAVQAAADAGDPKKLDSYIARFGWLAGATLRGWKMIREEQLDVDRVIDYEELLQQRSRGGGDDEDGGSGGASGEEARADESTRGPGEESRDNENTRGDNERTD